MLTVNLTITEGELSGSQTATTAFLPLHSIKCINIKPIDALLHSNSCCTDIFVCVHTCAGSCLGMKLKKNKNMLHLINSPNFVKLVAISWIWCFLSMVAGVETIE